MVKQGRGPKRCVVIDSSVVITLTLSKSSEEETSSVEEEEKPKFLFRPKFVPKCVCPVRIQPNRSC